MRFLASVGVLAIAVAIAAGVYTFGGFFNVAATVEDPAPVAWALQTVRKASIARRETIQSPISLDDPATIQEGARRYAQLGCASCHGGPGLGWAKFSEGLNPAPADLSEVAKASSVSHIYWVIRNGIRMTGMPSFEKAGVTDQQMWQIAAFVKRLPSVSEADYKSWTATPAQ